MENKIGNEIVINRKFVLKVYDRYSEQLVGVVVCVDEDEAKSISDEIIEYYISEGVYTSAVFTEIIEITENFVGDVWQEWAKDVERMIKYGHDDAIYSLTIISDDDYHEQGFHIEAADYDKMVFENENDPENKDFLGWYDVFRDAVINIDGEVIGTLDENSNFVRKEVGE